MPNPFRSELERRQRPDFEGELRRRDPGRGEGRATMQAVTEFGRGAGTGIAELAGAPVDIVSAGLSLLGAGHDRPVGGSRQLQEIMARHGMATQPDAEPTRASETGRVVGGASAALLPIVGPAARVSTAAQTGRTAQATTTGRGMLESIGQAATGAPGRFTAAEVGAATAAGLAGFEASQRYPDTPGAQALGEIAGGLSAAGAMAGAGPALRGTASVAGTAMTGVPGIGQMVSRVGRSVRDSFTVKGGDRRARDRVSRATDDATEALRRAGEADVLEEAPLTHLQRTGERGLLALERSVMESTPQLSEQRQRQFEDVNRAIRESLRATGDVERVSPEDTRQYLQGLLDTRLQVAAQRADERIAELGARANREDVDRLAREEINRALQIAQRQENELFAAVQRDVAAPLDSTEAVWMRHLTSRDRAADPEDLPAFLHRLVGRYNTETGTLEGGTLQENPTIGELQTLRSRVLQARREEAAKDAPNRRRLSILDDVQEALLDDMGVVSGDNPELQAALAFSRDKNERFTRGAVGRILGMQRTGEPSIPEGLTLEATIGRSGAAAREETDALLHAVERSGDLPAMRGHIESFLADGFTRAMRQSPETAQAYLRNKGDVLNRFPEMRRQMEQALTAGEEVRLAERGLDPKISRAAVFLNAPPGREIDRVLNQREPGRAIREVLDMAKNDPEGRAVQGVKAAFINRLMARAETRNLDQSDQPFISGARLREELADPRMQSVTNELFTQDERQRLDRIRNTALLMDRARTASPADEGVIGDAPGIAVALAARMGGAQLGLKMARHTGGGTVQTPGIVAGALRKAIERGVRDPASKVLSEAVQDEQLFRALTMDASTPARRQLVETRMNAWLAGVAPQAAEDAQEGFGRAPPGWRGPVPER